MMQLKNITGTKKEACHNNKWAFLPWGGLGWVFLLFFPIAALAQQITGRAPQQVAVGEQFRLSYTVNTDDVKGFRAGKIPDELEVLMGPSTSTQSSFQMVNGHMSSSSSVTYTYILCATKAGAFTIPPATATVGGKTIQSGELHVKASGQAQQGGAASPGGRQQGGRTGQDVRPAGTAIAPSDLFIKVSASKNRVREQEPILLTYKVYTLVGLTQLNGKMPDLKSFYTREVTLSPDKSTHVETLNGRQYRTVTWQQYVMFPQTTGKLEIPSITYEGIVVQQNRNVDPFEAFFNGGSGYIEVKKQIKAPGMTIQVDPLPERPQNFSGGVGRFQLTAQIDQTHVKANDPVKLRVVVSGVGNMKLLKQPQVKLPKDFDVYDPQVTDKTKLTTSGLEGSVTYEFLAVPRHQGTYDIPPIEYVYFDTPSGTYKTLRTEGFHLTVDKGSGQNTVASYGGQEDVRQLADDIRYIHTGATDLRRHGRFFFASTGYWMAVGLLLLAFVTLFVVFRQRAIDNANLAKQRVSKAGKVAAKRLKRAVRMMQEGHDGEFYDEVLRTLWGYVGDKLSMPVEQLSRDNIAQQLQRRGVADDVVGRFIAVLDDCEFARYAPGDKAGNMNKVYESAMKTITEIAEATKHGRGAKHSAAASAVAVVAMLLLVPTAAGARQTMKERGDSLYAAEQYQRAAEVYEQTLKQGESADLYYNLGNAYYRMDDVTRAILNYERALLLAPSDADVQLNLQMARSRTVDKVVPRSEMFFVTWYRSLLNLMSIDAWALTALLSLVAAIALALTYLFAQRVGVRKVGFFGALAFVVVFLLGNVFAFHQRSILVNRTGAIIISSAVPVKSTPAQNGTDLFILHEGTKVTITDGSMKQWKEVRMADGKQGWVEAKQIEII